MTKNIEYSTALCGELTRPDASLRREILIVEDDPSMCAYVEKILYDEAFLPITCGSGFSALDLLYTRPFSLIILDLGLPDLSGIEVGKRVRQDSMNRSTPLMILSNRSQEVDIVYGLGIGADDYVVKPIRAKEFIARVHVRLNKVHVASPESHRDKPCLSPHGSIEIDRTARRVFLDQSDLLLSQAEYRIFESLADANGQIVSREELIHRLTMGFIAVSDRNIDTHVKNIRRKLAARRDLLQTIRGFGYRLLVDPMKSR